MLYSLILIPHSLILNYTVPLKVIQKVMSDQMTFDHITQYTSKKWMCVYSQLILFLLDY